MTQENKITGTIQKIHKPESIGDQYHKLVFTVTNNDGYEGKEKLYAFEIFEKRDGEKVDNFLKFNKEGQAVDVSYEIRCNENNGRYFTSLSAWKVFANKGAGGGSAAPSAPSDEELDTQIPF